MKTCFCCKRTLELSEFYAHEAMGDGYLNKCKACVRSARRGRYWKDPETSRAKDRARYENPERQKQVAESYKRNRSAERNRLYSKTHTRRHPLARTARVAVNNAIRDGRLVRGPCVECGATPAEGHHDDYTKPLEVRWLCRRCHNEWHKHNIPLGLDPTLRERRRHLLPPEQPLAATPQHDSAAQVEQ